MRRLLGEQRSGVGVAVQSPGRGELATSSPTVKLEGLDRDDADALRALGRALNTSTYCRKIARALDPSAVVDLRVNIRPGCSINRLTADPERLHLQQTCTIDGTALEEDTSIRFAGGTFVTMRTDGIGYNGSPITLTKTLRFQGRHDGSCEADEGPGPTL